MSNEISLPRGFFRAVAAPIRPAATERVMRMEALEKQLIEYQLQQIKDGQLRDPGNWMQPAEVGQ